MPATLPSLEPRSCKQCTKVFPPKKPSQQYCSVPCRKKFHQHQQTRKRQEGMVQRADLKPAGGNHPTNWVKAASLASAHDLAAVLREMILNNPERQRVWMLLRGAMLREEQRWQHDVENKAELDEIVRRLEQGDDE